jgi:cobalt-precorrin 5A hydrolase / precorrin-3B C17-methyltransferase
MKPVIFTLGGSSFLLAERLAATIEAEVHAPLHLDHGYVGYRKAETHLQELFIKGHPIVAVCAAGIVIRLLAPVLRNKHDEPPVIVVSETGDSIVPLLGGHHGANALALRLAAVTNGHAAITTASDIALGVSIDEPPEGYVLANPQSVKHIVSRLLSGEKLKTNEHAPWLLPVMDSAGTIDVEVSIETTVQTDVTFYPRSLVVGVGCERGASPDEVKGLVEATLQEFNLAQSSIASYATIDLKEDEPAISVLGPVRYFSSDELKAQLPRVATPSAIVLSEVGTPSVAEAAALACAGLDSRLIVPKRKSERATCAVAEAAAPLLKPLGRPKGKLFVVGIGPGAIAHRSPSAKDALQGSSDWVGYELYLQLISDLRNAHALHSFGLGDEEPRVRHAIKLASQGKTVSLVCSGDAAIYAMASLVYEVLEGAGKTNRIEVEVIPGISAFQLASARAGAVVGHDFCCISLSDLLTPWQDIERRVQAAAEGDFVIAFYNPKSLRRTSQLDQAITILRKHRRATTPVIVASNVGRPTETVSVVDLQNFSSEVVDMLTVVIIGSNQTRMFKRGDGKLSVFTPRGYDKKRAS